jgi:hypothetical protein
VLLEDAGEHVGYLLLAGDVHRMEGGVTTLGANALSCFLPGLVVDVGNEDGGAFVSEPLRDVLPDALGSSRDESYLSGLFHPCA